MSRAEIVSRRGFKPSDRFDPTKREVLTSLGRKVLHLVGVFTCLHVLIYTNLVLIIYVLNLTNNK